MQLIARVLSMKSCACALMRRRPELAKFAREHESPAEQAEAVGALIRSWADMQDGGEQRETINHLVEGLDRERLSVRKRFPEEFEGRSW